MAGTATPIYAQLIVDKPVQILPADTTTLKTIVAGGTNGTKIESLIVTSTDTSARDVALYKTISAVDYLLGTVSIPITAGFTNAIPSIDLLNNPQIPGLSTDAFGNKYIFVASGTTLKIAALITITAAKAISVIASGGDY